MKKGQAAMEFLMTYGWAILVVIAAIAALAYFGVLDPARLLPERCQFPAGMDCLGKASIDGTADTVTFTLRNNIGFNADINSINVTEDTGNCNAFEVSNDLGANWVDPSVTPVTVRNNERLQVRLSGCTLTANDKYQATVAVGYIDTNTGLQQRAAGDIRGRAT